MTELKDLQKIIDEHIKKHGGYWPPLSILARLTEEVGEVARNVNIRHGDKKVKPGEELEPLEEELADVLVVLIALANYHNIDLESELLKKVDKDLLRNKGVYFK